MSDCEQAHSSLGAALASIPALADIDDGSGPRRPSVQLFVVPDASGAVEMLEGPLSVDLTGPGMTTDLALDFGGLTLCNDSSLVPALRLIGGELLFLQNLVVDGRDQGPCLGSASPALMLETSANVGISDVRILGWTGYAVADSGLGAAPAVNLSQSEIGLGSGVAVKLRGALRSTSLLIAYNHLVAEFGEAALVNASGGVLNIDDSLFLANRIDVVAAQDSALLRGRGRIARSAFVGNVLEDSTSLLQIGLDEWPTFTPEEPHLPDSPHGLSELSLVQNVFTTMPQDWTSPSLDLPHLSGGSGACHLSFDAGTLDALPLPQVSPDGSGQLVRIDSDFGFSEDAQLAITRSFMVQNGGQGTLFGVSAPGSNLSIQLLNNTFADNGFSNLMTVYGGSQGLDVSMARNLALEPNWVSDPVAWDSAPRRLLSTQNHAFPAAEWTAAPSGIETVLRGPTFALEAPSFIPVADVEAIDGCGQMQLLCPGAPPDDCETEEHDPPFLCPVGVAAQYLPSADWTAASAAPWPWGGDFFSVPPATSIPGATGWACGAGRWSHDQVPHPTRGGDVGDGDGFPTVFDCDNADPTIFPVLPEHDGYSSEYCVEPEGTCYVCPNGENPPPISDDDDSASDDDDSATDDDDSATVLPPDDDDVTFEEPPEPTCRIEGCGVGWIGHGAVLLLVMPWRRRRV